MSTWLIQAVALCSCSGATVLSTSSTRSPINVDVSSALHASSALFDVINGEFRERTSEIAGEEFNTKCTAQMFSSIR